ncbi:MAG: alpha-amylase family glycosyl hydrolase, partial [Chloroflexota bacterium]
MSDAKASPRLFPLALLLVLVIAALIPASSAAAPAQVNVAGSFEESLGGANWSNNDALTDMSDDNGDGVWKFSANLPIAETYEYKIVEDANWDLAYPAANVPFTVANAGDEVRWYYDENDHYVADSTNQVIAAVAGDFAAAIGGADWAPDHLMTWMKDPDGDGLYVYLAQGVPEGDYAYKVALDEGWAVAYPASNRSFSVPAGGSDVTFYYDSATNDVWEEVGEEPGLLVTFPGSYPAAASLGNDWDPANLNTQASDDNGDGVWKFVTDAIPAGSYEFKATVGGSWDENYGLNGVPGGDNVPFNVTGGETVHFYYDRSDNYVASRPDFVIAAAVGDFQNAIGCGDWQPECLRSWLKDPDGDGIYSFTTSDIPAGDYEAKVAHNESWDENYGAGGAPGGDNILFSVSEGATVNFDYELSSHILTISTSGLEPGDEELVREPVRTAAANDFFYFVLPDRFQNGDPANDSGGDVSGDPLVNGFLPTDKGYYHGGDIAGLMEKLDYLENLGVTAIWMTPQFTNSWVQGDGTIAGSSAAYHGYWQIDYTQIDPHFGTNQELKDFIDAAHSREMKVYFDIVINHTGDVITYDEGVFTYRNKDDYP